MKKFTLTPVRLRIMLSIAIVLLVGAGVGMYMFGYQQLKTHAAAAQEVAVQAEVSRSSLEDLVSVKDFLAKNNDAVQRADQLVAESKSYQYQDQIISDLNTYAQKSGLQITNVSFTDAKVTAGGATAAPAAGATVTGGVTTTPAPAGIKSMTASVTLKSPMSYNSLLNFIHLIEQSLFRMQVSRVGLSQSTEADGSGKITSEAFTIEVYVR